MAPIELKDLKALLEEMLQVRFIHSSTSPLGELLLFIKKYSSFWLCIDYRQLSQVTVKNWYILSRIDVLFDQVKTSEVFFTIDLHSSYHQLCVKDGDILRQYLL